MTLGVSPVCEVRTPPRQWLGPLLPQVPPVLCDSRRLRDTTAGMVGGTSRAPGLSHEDRTGHPDAQQAARLRGTDVSTGLSQAPQVGLISCLLLSCSRFPSEETEAQKPT